MILDPINGDYVDNIQMSAPSSYERFLFRYLHVNNG